MLLLGKAEESLKLTGKWITGRGSVESVQFYALDMLLCSNA